MSTIRTSSFFRVLVACAFVSVVCGVFTRPATAYADDLPADSIVWRADLLSPDDMIRQGGFLPRGTDGTRPNQPPPNISLFEHVAGTSTGMSTHTSGYVATTRSRSEAMAFIRDRLAGNGYLYQIHVSPNFIDAAETLQHFYRHPHERELAALGGIHADQVVSWTRVSFGVAETSVRNSRFNLGRYRGLTDAGGQPQLAGFPEGHAAWRQEPWSAFAACGMQSRSASVRTSASSTDCSVAEANQIEALDFMQDTSADTGIDWCCDITPVIFRDPADNRLAYVLFGGEFGRIEVPAESTVEQGGVYLYPRPLAPYWQALTSIGFDRVDAVLQHPQSPLEIYVFSGQEYALMSMDKRSLIGGPKSISQNWPSLARAGFTSIDAVLPNPDNAHEAYFFSGDQYALISIAPGTTNDRLINGPKPIAENWPSLVKAGFGTVDTAMVDPKNPEQNAYFFSGDEYALIRIAPGTTDDVIVAGPSSIAENWKALDDLGFWAE